ncbi:MAG: recombinase family protein [Bacillota bacterium]|nr:recombinase family protein [Bacillota bacterium]
MIKVWNVAIYARVSTDRREQQESIPAQVESLKNWLKEISKNNTKEIYKLVASYEDAGFTGSNFDRGSFIRMKEDIELGKINMVLTRDLSRFSRNYVLAGYYLEDYFKENGIRFVSVLDNVDTLMEVDDIVPFKNILNEMYIKDCSRRIRDGLRQRMLLGSCIASKAPYGYIFKEDKKSNLKMVRLVAANDESSDTVKDIFNLYIQGWGMSRIAKHLNEKGINPPSNKNDYISKSSHGAWKGNTIKSILTNPKYGGIMAQGRWKKLSYKIKKVGMVPEEQWVYGGEFEGIVSKETFNMVQELMKKRKSSFRQKNNNVHLFSGVLQCGECAGSMCYRQKYKGYKCTNSQKGGAICSAHSIKEEFLKEILAKDLRERVKNIDIQFIHLKGKEVVLQNSTDENVLNSIDTELNKINNLINKIYLDRINGIIREENFQEMLKNIQLKQDKLINKRQYEESEKGGKNCRVVQEKIGKGIDSLLSFDKLDRNIIERLIKKIVIHEDRNTGDKTVDVYYNFVM